MPDVSQSFTVIRVVIEKTRPMRKKTHRLPSSAVTYPAPTVLGDMFVQHFDAVPLSLSRARHGHAQPGAVLS